MKRIITGHNRRMTDPEEGLKLENCDRKGNCKDQCFEEGEKCQSRCTVYQASLQYEEPHSSIPALKIPVSKICTGFSKPTTLLSTTKIWVTELFKASPPLAVVIIFWVFVHFRNFVIILSQWTFFATELNWTNSPYICVKWNIFIWYLTKIFSPNHFHFSSLNWPKYFHQTISTDDWYRFRLIGVDYLVPESDNFIRSSKPNIFLA